MDGFNNGTQKTVCIKFVENTAASQESNSKGKGIPDSLGANEKNNLFIVLPQIAQ
jgi:hypothetical protein